MELKTYNPQCSHTSSSIGAWVNYSGASTEEFEKTRKQVFHDFPGCVIVDGNDDWSAPKHERPQTFLETFGITALAYYHSGISGITRSGIVISQESLQLLQKKYYETYNLSLHLECKIYMKDSQ